MWNLMIVEDEAIVRLGLKSMNVWHKHQINWAIEASNGEEALANDNLENIHILITDIRMPRVDGLELASRIRERNRDIQIIFLSSYDDFDYVKKALQIGAVDYLHKPTMGEEDISNILEKAILNLRNLSIEGQKDLGYRDVREKNYFLLTMIDRYTRPFDWEVKWKQYGLPDEWESYLLVRLRITEQKSSWDNDPQSRNSLHYSVGHFIEEYLKKNYESLVFTRGLGEIILLLAPLVNDREAVKQYVYKLIKAVQELLNVELRFACSHFYSDWERIPDAYLDALMDNPGSTSDYSPIIRKAHECIQQRFCEDLTLAALAEELNISMSYLSRQFSKEVGENFVDMLTRKRMIHAKKMLRESNMKVYEISDHVGYKNSHYFSRLFKEIVGITPMEYRSSRKDN
jgi:two-component system response regulator YesN